MKGIGVLTYTSLHCNFTNYGTVLQSWALCKAIKKFFKNNDNWLQSLRICLVNYCPESMQGMNPLNPFENMWDKDEETRNKARRLLPLIEENFYKVKNFYQTHFDVTSHEYALDNFDSIKTKDDIDKFVIGSDSIWDIEEFGIDPVFFANTVCTKNNSIAYAPSFQDSIDLYTPEQWVQVKTFITSNFLSVGLRDINAASLISQQTQQNIPVVCDPTLLLPVSDYAEIESEQCCDYGEYILFYTRRKNPDADEFVKKISNEYKLKIIEISINGDGGNILCYDAGIEEFLTLIKNANIVVTNSFHCMIFSVLYHKDFWVYSRPHCFGKIMELLKSIGLTDRFIDDFSKLKPSIRGIDYNKVDNKIDCLRQESINYLYESLTKLIDRDGRIR